MKQGSTLFLKASVLLVAVVAIFICAYALPKTIGSINLSGYDSILLGLYLPAIPFFFALYQAMKLLNLIEKKKAFSSLAVKAFRNIKYAAIIISGLFTLGMPYIFYVADKDDAPGVVALGLVTIFASFVIATFAAVLQKLIQNAVDIKSENDLTV